MAVRSEPIAEVAPRPRVLALCHRTAADPAARSLAAWSSGDPLDLLCYGRSSEDLPPPEDANLAPLPELSGGVAARAVAAVRWILMMRRRRYEQVVVAQPALALSRARGLLVAFGHVLGARRVVLFDPRAGRVHREVSRRLALVELLRFAAWQALGPPVAAVGAAACGRLSTRTSPPREPPAAGRAVYLRTDIDLALGPLQAGGSVAHTAGILGAFLRRGYATEFWTTGEVGGVPGGVPQRRLPVLLRGNVPTEIAELASGLAQGLVRDHGTAAPAVIYQRYSLNNLAGAILARRWRVPLVLEANGSEHKWRSDWSNVVFPRLAAATERLILNRADRVAVVSENARRDLLAAGAPPERTVVVPNGVDVERFARARPARLPFESGTFVVAFVGLFYPWHGVRHLARAFPSLLEQEPGARLLLLGDGEDAAYVRHVLEEKGAMGAVHMPGMVDRDEVPRFLAACDAVVSPHADVKDFIGSPIKIFEYMASGRAIVASRVAQIGDVLEHERTALLVEPEDPPAIAAALLRLARDEPLRRRIGEAAQAEARASHSWDVRLAEILGARA